MKEIWKDVIGYEGNYQASNLGNFRSLDRYVKSHNQWGEYERFIKGGKMHPHVNNRFGYLQIKLTIDGVGKTERVHILVAKTFIPNPEGHPEIHHIDYNKSNNSVSNLKWVTRKENQEDMGRHYKKTIDNKCVDCSAVIGEKSIRCSKHHYQSMRLIKMEVKDLQELLCQNNGNLSKVGRILNVSANSIVKRLKRNNLPYHRKDYKQK